jgi:5-methylcytosine-specific restriction endonuclease McrA
MADGNIWLPASGCKTCEGCGASGVKTFKSLCADCMSTHKAIRRSNAKRVANGRTGLPPLLRTKASGGDSPVTQTLHVCAVCTKQFYPKHADRTKCCSRACGLLLTGHQAAVRGTGTAVVHRVMRVKCKGCGSRFNQANGKQFCGNDCASAFHARTAANKERAAYVPRAFKCKCCGADVVTVYGQKQAIYCSDVCMKRTTKRVGRKVRDARKRGALRAERVDPLLVFERDGWRCGICSKLTLRTKRGKMHPRAPELDHIVTLADGGDHTYANTQCACRKCNGLKGAKTYGQLHLFPAG